MTINDLIHNFAGWLDISGEFSGIVISSRARLARNLQSLPFVHRATDEQLSTLVDTVLTAKSQSPHLERTTFFNLDELSKADRQILVERHLISPELAKKKGQRGILVDNKEIVSVMINEEDHLRLQAIQPGFQPRNVWSLVDKIDDELSGVLDFSFSPKYGYLTACPTNVGTGLRVSVLIHLPALVLTQEIDKVLRAVAQVGLAVRGFYGEGTDVVGNLFQISNQTTLGKAEHEIIEGLERIIREVVDQELKARGTLLKDAKLEIEDKVWRALGILENARLLTSQEFMNLSSATRLGYAMDLIAFPEIKVLNELMVLTQPYHLQRLVGRSLRPSERDKIRANLVRERLRDDKPEGGVKDE
ncbi:MAG TPA: protein arginine kinase [Candidatus Latescibacteria bacterium]|nr:protein arginine kinase [Candidatus Latescibacterota bacterium]